MWVLAKPVGKITKTYWTPLPVFSTLVHLMVKWSHQFFRISSFCVKKDISDPIRSLASRRNCLLLLTLSLLKTSLRSWHSWLADYGPPQSINLRTSVSVRQSGHISSVHAAISRRHVGLRHSVWRRGHETGFDAAEDR